MKHMDIKSHSNLIIGIVFILTGVFIGMLLTFQFRSSIPATVFPTDVLEAQTELIDSFISDQGLLKTKIVTLRTQINEAQEQAKVYVEDTNLEVLKVLKQDMGLEQVRGPGVEITLSDGAFVNRESADEISQSMIHASDLRDLVNVLRTAKVDAIAINDQRIIASTPITSVGNTILVNNFHLLPPFSVAAVGDQELIMQRLNDSSALPDLQKRASELKIQYKAEEKDGLTAPVYNGNLSAKYLNELTATES
jgi:uncharacterized protein YlxW (UPF0749 family)